MAKTIVAFSGTPRIGGNSEILADHILAGAAETGATVERIRLHDMTISPCIACGACAKSDEPKCVIDDDAGPLIKKLFDADAFVLASPIYFFTVCAQLKAFMDRWYVLFSRGPIEVLKGKHMAAALTYGDKDPLTSGVVNAVGTFRDNCRLLRMNFVGCVHAACVDKGEVATNETAIQKARELGKKLAEA